MSLKSFKLLHHQIGPYQPLLNGSLEGEIDCTEENIKLLKDCNNSQHSRVDDTYINGKDISLKELTPCNSKISISLKILESDSSLIFKDQKSLLNRRLSLSSGSSIEDFYFWATGEDSTTENGKELKNKINSICTLIKGLADLAHYHDNKVGTDNPNYVFVNESDISNGSPLVIETSISESMLLSPPIDVSIFEVLSSSKSEKNNPNIGREKSVFRATLIEYLKSKPSYSGDEFNFLIHGWNDFLTLFRRNFDTYISGFAFHKARKEVADAELSIANELSKIMGEIGGKALGVPISMVAIIPMLNTTSTFEVLLISLGLLISSIISSQVIFNQQNQLERVIHAKNIMFPQEDSTNSNYPDFLKALVSSASRNLEKNQTKLSITLWFFRIISWLPALLAVIATSHLFMKIFDAEIFISVFIPLTIIVILIKNEWARKRIFNT